MIRSYTVSRHIPATKDGELRSVALATIIHDNGEQQTVVIDEEKIRLHGEDIIAADVYKASQNPTQAGLDFRLGRKQ